MSSEVISRFITALVLVLCVSIVTVETAKGESTGKKEASEKAVDGKPAKLPADEKSGSSKDTQKQLGEVKRLKDTERKVQKSMRGTTRR